YLGNKINLNIGIRYSEDEDKTLIYIATPIIKLDY
ncbi:MAG: YwmB family TATA-box binding protein, partial [Romboutsia sp.]|nr:YwmB family TATA-box binding protein [Romboutsia sp.]